MPKNARILFRDGDSFYTQIDERHTPETLAGRMTSGGFVVCRDARWGRTRTLVINLTDVKCVVIEEPTSEGA